MDFFENWEENYYNETFDNIYESLLAQYKAGKTSIPELERNLQERQQILLNAFHEGASKSAYNNAVVDAHHFILSLIKNGKI
ncbi:hypothetical protein [Fusobacterium sp. PH5-44]|uniref:hypothetical protein n=1 Tax=unclassified Fusobacterium TaxID=2648384 RepID=UPI003D2216DC